MRKINVFFFMSMLYINMHVLTSNLVHLQAYRYPIVAFSKALLQVPYSGVFESATIGIQQPCSKGLIKSHNQSSPKKKKKKIKATNYRASIMPQQVIVLLRPIVVLQKRCNKSNTKKKKKQTIERLQKHRNKSNIKKI